METRSFKNHKFWKYTALTSVILYTLIWCIGYYRVTSLVNNLRAENEIKRYRIEYCFKSIKKGDSVNKLEAILDIGETIEDEKITNYHFSYFALIQETSSVSNRMSKHYRIEAINGKVININQGGAIDHGDRFMSHWRFYPTVCFLGLRTYEDE